MSATKRMRRLSLMASVTALCVAPVLAQEMFPAPAKRVETNSSVRNVPLNRDATYSAALAARQKLLASLSPVTDAMLRRPADKDWLHWRRTYESLSHSPLKQIAKSNVRNLRTAWILRLPVSVNQITPLVHDGVLFVQSGTSVQALDAATGESLWQYVHPLPHGNYRVRDARMKHLGIYEDRLYAATPDGRMIALDSKTGKLVWNTDVTAGLATLQDGENFWLNSGPLIAGGMAIIGVAGTNTIAGGNYIVGLDARTGEKIWRFGTIALPGQPGGDSWNGVPPSQRYGAGVWTSGSYDPNRNLVYFGTGNTYNIGALIPKKTESNDALYTDSTIALNPRTGKLAWYYQHMNRDVWRMDWAFERSLISLPVKGENKDVVVTGGKIAIFDVLDRANGQYVSSVDFGLQNIVTSIDPVTGRKTTDPAMELESGKSIFFCPNSNGGRNWPTTAYDPATGILYAPLFESCADYVWTARTPAEVAAGGADSRTSQRAPPGSDGKFGRLQAVDLKTGKTVWTYRQRATMASSLLTTAGGMVFAGGFDRFFRAHDSATGAILWETALDAPPNSSPITYDVNGEQFVAVTAGAGGPLDGGTAPMMPEIQNPPMGVTLWVFSLPKP